MVHFAQNLRKNTLRGMVRLFGVQGQGSFTILAIPIPMNIVKSQFISSLCLTNLVSKNYQENLTY